MPPDRGQSDLVGQFVEVVGGVRRVQAPAVALGEHQTAAAPAVTWERVHRDTVANRITQIERALGNSLDEPQVRVSAWIAPRVATGAI